jgi:hypothetical protein
MYSCRYWGFSDRKSFFSSRSLLTILLDFCKVSLSRFFTLSRSAICSACPAGLTNWKAVAFPHHVSRLATALLAFLLLKSFVLKKTIMMKIAGKNHKKYNLLFISQYLCVTSKLSFLPTIHPNRSDIKYSSPSFLLSLT